ncbi:hypothetical protein Daesc_009578 [Daldinia eschscholtzii]|uniref:C2H2-type domain-containing protein n=1 Tax=Daldinia eschscholtzii TaxID=292717 RepID=A0AAX6MAP5_9PEZI
MKGALGRWLTGTTRTPFPATNDTEHPFSSRSSAENNNNSSAGSGSDLAAAAAPTPTSSHSLTSPSPSPQPATPDDQFNFPGRNNYFASASNGASINNSAAASAPASPLSLSASKPIDIATNNPRIRNSNSASPPPGQLNPTESDWLQVNVDGDLDLEMTTGPALDSAVSRSRQDSFVSAGPKPISMINPNREQANRGRRESLAGSLMNGMSWGGVSVGSFIRDDLVMTGTSPFTGAHQSPSFHSNSYIPKMEAEYLRNFICCDLKLDTMHDLLRHYETVHTGQNAQPNRNGSGIPMPHRLSVNNRPSMSMGVGRQDSQGFQHQTQMGSSQRFGNMGSNLGSGMGFGGMQMGRQSSGMDSNAQKRNQQLNRMQSNDEMDAVGDMEMDDTVGMMEMDDNQRTIQQTRQMFGQQQRPQLSLSTPGLQHQALRTSQPSTPGAGNFGFQNNPTVSSVNTPTLTTQQAALGQQMGGNNKDGMGEMDFSSLGNLNLNNMGGGFDGSNLSEYFIDDPAKRLYSPGGGPASQRALQQQMAQFGLDASQFGNITDPNHLAALQRAIANPGSLVIPPEEDKPFKCPVIGCEKAYKNQNGLKYHKQHGHQNQQLHENGDGSFSIVNPETSAPYPGETGMEKEKPHKCEYCHKRYKNLNGLKYHKQHSSACEIQAQAANIRANLAANNHMSFNMANISHGLPGIGEEMQL